MCGLTKMHAANKTPTEYAYYVCQYNPNTPATWRPPRITRAPSRSAKTSSKATITDTTPPS